MAVLSVISTIYNAERYLPYIQECIDSAVNQTYHNFEFLIMYEEEILNDIINRYKSDSRIEFIKKDNMHFIDAFNELGYMCTGKYITRLDIDDFIHRDKFKKQINYLSENNNIDLLATKGNVLYEGLPENITEHIENEIGKINIDFDQENFSDLLLKDNFLLQSSVIMRKEVFISLNGWNKCLVDDYDFWIRAAKKGYTFYRLNDYLTTYRLHKKGNSLRNSPMMKSNPE